MVAPQFVSVRTRLGKLITLKVESTDTIATVMDKMEHPDWRRAGLDGHKLFNDVPEVVVRAWDLASAWGARATGSCVEGPGVFFSVHQIGGQHPPCTPLALPWLSLPRMHPRSDELDLTLLDLFICTPQADLASPRPMF